MGDIKTFIFIVVICILFTTVIPAAQAGRIRGVVYDQSFNPVLKIFVTINTTPEQIRISTTGAYYFIVPEGNYQINASFVKNNVTQVIASLEVMIKEDDDIVQDLTVFEGYDVDYENNKNWWTKTRAFIISKMDIFILFLLIISVVAIVMVTLSWYRKRILKNNRAKNDALESNNNAILEGMLAEQNEGPSDVTDVNVEIIHPADEKAAPIETTVVITPPPITEPKTGDQIMQEKIISLIGASNATLTQKDLRKEFSVSEAKISMLLSEMETKGIIKKVKKGRTNYIQLVRVIKNS